MLLSAPKEAAFETQDASQALNVAATCRGMNFFQIDREFGAILRRYMEEDALQHFTPHFDRLGALAGGKLDELAFLANRHPPVLHHRDARGNDDDWIEYHPAYREMEKIAWGDFGMHLMSNTSGVLGWPKPASPLIKFSFIYLFVQAEFGLTCPNNATDGIVRNITRFGSNSLVSRYSDRLFSRDPERLIRGATWMTERTGGSDISGVALKAVRDGDAWRLYGDKWFCSSVDGDLCMVLARPEGAPPGSKSLGQFVVPRRLEDGSRNSYRVVRLKDKLGSSSMASGEVVFDGAVAYLLGELENGLKQQLSSINMTRLAQGVRASGMMRRCLNEAMTAARTRKAFGRYVIEHPLMRRQLAKIMLPTEQGLSMFGFGATLLDRARADRDAAAAMRLVAPLYKFRACRDNVTVATGAMEARGGNGYIEDWVNPRLVRDAHLGLLWEGTSNVIAIDIVRRAVSKGAAADALRAVVEPCLSVEGMPSRFRGRLSAALDRAILFAQEVGREGSLEGAYRTASSMLYHSLTAILLASEGATAAHRGEDARRLLMAKQVLDHRFGAQDPFDLRFASTSEKIVDHLLSDDPVTAEGAYQLVDAGNVDAARGSR